MDWGRYNDGGGYQIITIMVMGQSIWQKFKPVSIAPFFLNLQAQKTIHTNNSYI